MNRRKNEHVPKMSENRNRKKLLTITFNGITFDAIDMEKQADFSGGNGKVYILKKKGVDQPYVAKVLKSFKDGEERYQRFVQEIETVEKLFQDSDNAHKYLVPILHSDKGSYAKYKKGSPIYFVMPKFEPYGKMGSHSLEEIVVILSEVLECIRFIHDKGLSHRDIKRGNILRDSSGHWRLSDFGLAVGDDSQRLTKIGELVGPKGRPPTFSRLNGEDMTNIDPSLLQSDDLYLFGKLCWQLLTDQISFFDGEMTPNSPQENLLEKATENYRFPILPLILLICNTVKDNKTKRIDYAQIKQLLEQQTQILLLKDTALLASYFKKQVRFFRCETMDEGIRQINDPENIKKLLISTRDETITIILSNNKSIQCFVKLIKIREDCFYIEQKESDQVIIFKVSYILCSSNDPIMTVHLSPTQLPYKYFGDADFNEKMVQLRSNCILQF